MGATQKMDIVRSLTLAYARLDGRETFVMSVCHTGFVLLLEHAMSLTSVCVEPVFKTMDTATERLLMVNTKCTMFLLIRYHCVALDKELKEIQKFNA